MRLKSAKQAKRVSNHTVMIPLVVPRRARGYLPDLISLIFTLRMMMVETVPYIFLNIPFYCSYARLTTTGDYMSWGFGEKKVLLRKDSFFFFLLLSTKEIFWSGRREILFVMFGICSVLYSSFYLCTAACIILIFMNSLKA